MARQTIRLYLFLSCLIALSPSLHLATYVLYLLSKGLNLFEVNLVNTVFYVTLAFCEIPTGLVADTFGRKLSCVISCALTAIGLFIYAYANSFVGYASAEAVLAIGGTFLTGAFEAWMVDRLKWFGYAEPLTRVFSQEKQIRQIVGIIGGITGAYLFGYSKVLPWIAGGFISAVTCAVMILLMREEHFERKHVSMRGSLLAMCETFKFSFGYCLRNGAVRFVMLLGLVQTFAFQAPNMQWQPFFANRIADPTLIGFVWAGVSLAIILGSRLSPRFLEVVKCERLLMRGCQLIAALGIILASVSGNVVILSLVFFYLHESARGCYGPVASSYLNQNIPSNERATLISFESMSHHIGGAVGLVVSGYLAQHYGIRTTWIIVAGIMILITFFLKGAKEERVNLNKPVS